MLGFAVVLGLFLTSPALSFADDSHDGKVVSTTEGSGSSDGKLVMTDKDGKGEHGHAISSSTKITRDGKTVKLGDLKKGDSITVTMSDGKVKGVAATASKSTDSNGKSNVSDLLQNLNLSSDQRTKIDDIVKKYDDECKVTWKEFADDYQSAIRMEASMLARIEEHFNDAQRKHVRDQRRRTAHHRRHDGKTNVKVNSNAPEEEIVIIGITLTPQQQEKADGIRRNYNDRLGSLNDNIERLQAKMLSLETEKLLEIEDVLTKEQRDQLRKDHEKLTQNADASSDKTSTK
jgi:hypothetical protein